MKSVMQLMSTINDKCENSGMDYSWYCTNIKCEDDKIATFEIRRKSTDNIILMGAIECYTDYSFDMPTGFVTFNFKDGRDNNVQLNVQDYKCEVGSIYMNDIVDMAIKMIYR